MQFNLNNTKWTIKKTEKQWMLDKYNIEHKVKAYAMFGLCDYTTHIIHLNEELEKTQMIQTLKHELTHCWLWVYGASYVSYSEEDVCNKVSAMCDFVYETTKKFINVLEEKNEKN